MFQPGGPTLLELLDQALSSTTAGYDKLAPKFDKTPFRTPDSVLAVMAREIGEERSVGSALDLCCGTGAAMVHLRPLCRERIVGIDLSEGMLAVAGMAVRGARGTAAVELVRGDVLALSEDSSFDLVTSTGAFGHIEERDEPAFLGGIFRALKPGGRFVFVTGRPPPPTSAWFWLAHGFNAAMHVRNAVLSPKFIMIYLTFLWPEVRAKLEAAGFRVDARMGLFPSPYERGVLVTATRPRKDTIP